LDVAFAAGAQWKSKTKVFLDALGDRLVRYVDHHEHREAWPSYEGDARFVLVPNKIAHACPELVTPELVAASGHVDDIVAHADFDGCVAAVKWLRGGREPYAGADEDARAAESDARKLALDNGRLEAPGVFVVRVPSKPDNRTRRNLLVVAEEHAPVGALFEPDPAGGAWLIAATFDEGLDLEEVAGFEGGRSDYRFARAHGEGVGLIGALSGYVTRTKG
jgi:hypothetical protein